MAFNTWGKGLGVLPHCRLGNLGICTLDERGPLHSDCQKRYCQHQGTWRCHRSVQSCLALPEPFLTATLSIHDHCLGASGCKTSDGKSASYKLFLWLKYIEVLWALDGFSLLSAEPCLPSIAWSTVKSVSVVPPAKISWSHGFGASKGW